MPHSNYLQRRTTLADCERLTRLRGGLLEHWNLSRWPQQAARGLRAGRDIRIPFREAALTKSSKMGTNDNIARFNPIKSTLQGKRK
jgi:hypothetical protein